MDDPVAYVELALDCDRNAVLNVYRTELREESGDYEVAAIDCVVEALGDLSDSDFARLAVDRARLDEIAAGCEL
ncbi:MAG: hypothetical protein ACRDL4_14185 [Thermoleophilaceae bacterium]